MSNQLQRGLKRLIKITHGCTDTRFSMFFFSLFIHVFFFFSAHVNRPVEELSIRRRVADCIAGEISPSHGGGGNAVRAEQSCLKGLKGSVRGEIKPHPANIAGDTRPHVYKGAA